MRPPKQYGRENIEIAMKDIRKDSCDNSEDEDKGDRRNHLAADPNSNNVVKPVSSASNGKLKNGGVPNSTVVRNGGLANSVISREDLILVPDPEQNYSNNIAKEEVSSEDATHAQTFPRRMSFETLKREFELADCLDYIKTGVEAIIEDQVTMRFEAEELKSWNLLTRTNLGYEFISWRLTIIWMLGFLMRYFFLLPLRIIICFIGISWLVVAEAFVGLLPDCWLKRWLNYQAYVSSFRVLARAVTADITVHNKQYKPKLGGVCVANHTTPIDVVVLSTEHCFCLVSWCSSSYLFPGCSLLPLGCRARESQNIYCLSLCLVMCVVFVCVVYYRMLQVMWLTMCTGFVGYVPEGPFKRWLNHRVSIMCFGILSSALSSVITYHNPENRPQRGICVANHTSPIDVLVLACDNSYALIGQRHGGFLGVLQRALARASPHIWFERSEVKDREAVARRLREHVSDPNNPPILIFPEGTCINNTSVMQFKKGSFEVGSVIYPVAIKYDPKFGDAFWNSSRFSMIQYLYMMMTSWAIVCDVWYLPPMYQQEGESAIDFANRVKSVIARQGGLVDLMWLVGDWEGAKCYTGRSAQENEAEERMEREAARGVQ
uniref:Phospholipid/glycerol acyltransferase domain-containing protein n=1 Tax=Timema tahoe TaxID=61484 RepID=A0A7R9ID98_9NEOP|nr:unnamed protein product [Timema tahoe]